MEKRIQDFFDSILNEDVPSEAAIQNAKRGHSFNFGKLNLGKLKGVRNKPTERLKEEPAQKEEPKEESKD